nr:AAC(3) family N-acetyltransferase [uncultured Cohaesibacter sp.]
MNEEDIIRATSSPLTRAHLHALLCAGGVEVGSVVITHISLRALGWVAGGPVAVIEALLDAVGPEGTLVMPSFTNLSNPEHWQRPPIPQDWFAILEAQMPAYDARITPTRGMGVTAELFRTWPGALRSAHPHTPFAALGPKAGEILASHSLEHPFAAGSPLEKLYELEAQTLLLGVGFDKFTMLHLAESMAWPDRPLEPQAAPIMKNGARHWKRYCCEPAGETAHFEPILDQLLHKGLARAFPVGSGKATLVPNRAAVDVAVEQWRSMPFPQ